MRPVLPHTSVAEMQAFREQVQPVDMIGRTDISAIHARIAELSVHHGAFPDRTPVTRYRVVLGKRLRQSRLRTWLIWINCLRPARAENPPAKFLCSVYTESYSA